MAVNLEKFYPSTQRDSKKLLKLVKDYADPETLGKVETFLKEQFTISKSGLKTAVENRASYRKGTVGYTMYGREITKCTRLCKLYTVSLEYLKN